MRICREQGIGTGLEMAGINRAEHHQEKRQEKRSFEGSRSPLGQWGKVLKDKTRTSGARKVNDSLSSGIAGVSSLKSLHFVQWTKESQAG